jgi:hypothetical protein
MDTCKALFRIYRELILLNVDLCKIQGGRLLAPIGLARSLNKPFKVHSRAPIGPAFRRNASAMTLQWVDFYAVHVKRLQGGCEPKYFQVHRH